MSWVVKYSEQASRSLRKLDKTIQEKIGKFIERLPNYPNPRDIGKSLTVPYAGKWRYRVGDYRIICAIHDNVLVIEVVKIDHRSKVYKK